jgi:hypothetical protein
MAVAVWQLLLLLGAAVGAVASRTGHRLCAQHGQSRDDAGGSPVAAQLAAAGAPHGLAMQRARHQSRREDGRVVMRQVIDFVIRLVALVDEQKEFNRMPFDNLAIVFSPSFLRNTMLTPEQQLANVRLENMFTDVARNALLPHLASVKCVLCSHESLLGCVGALPAAGPQLSGGHARERGRNCQGCRAPEACRRGAGQRGRGRLTGEEEEHCRHARSPASRMTRDA